ncbi:MAG: transporter substrate-binding domain-containing protein, partial [Clostridia bacterium]|nr:transporter substrate-binding domain-containing protein [Clostridia bacterium]
STTAFALDTTDIKQPVRAGVFNFEGYHMKDENGGLTGYGIEFLNLVSQYSHINFQYTEYDASWDDMLDLLEKGKIDVTTSASKTPEREEKFDFSLPIGRRKTVLSIKHTNNDEDDKYIRGDYSTYNGIRIGLVKGSSQNKLLPDFATKYGFKYTTKEYDDSPYLAAAFQTGSDIYQIISSNLIKAQNEDELYGIEEDDFYAIVRKGDTDLLREINYAIRQMDINEGDWKNVLFYKYYGPVYSDALSFNERERAYLSQVVAGEKSITVTAFGSRAPYSYTENGKLKGILPDYLAEIMELAAKEMGVPEIPYTLVAPADAKDYNRLASGGVNLVLDRVDQDAIKEDEVASCFKTNSYMTVRMARVTRQNFNSKIRTVAVSDSQGKDLVGPYIKNYEVLTYPTAEEALRAVLNGDADVAYVYSYTAQYFINHGHADTLSYSSINGMLTQTSMHISPTTDHELLTILNKCIKQIPDDTLNQLALNYTIDTEDMDFGAYMRKHPEIIIGIVLVVVVIISLIITLYLRERWSKKLLSNTQQSSQKMGEHLAIVAALSRDYTNVFTIDEAEGTAR